MGTGDWWATGNGVTRMLRHTYSLGLLQRELRSRQEEAGRRVVHQDVDRPAERLDGRGDQTSPVVLVGQIRDDRRHLLAVAAEAGGRLGEAPGPRVVVVEGAGGERHVGALGREALGDAGPDPPARAGHQRSPPREPPTGRHASSLSVRKPSRHSPM
jgi:hypothetical protein